MPSCADRGTYAEVARVADERGTPVNADLAMWGACCRAFATMPYRLARPRRPDRRLLASLTGSPRPLPPARATVALTAFPQGLQSAPTMAVAEGVLRPPVVTLAMTSWLVEHPRARFLVDPALCADVHDRVLPELPRGLRTVVAPERPVAGLGAALTEAGVAPEEIAFTLPTHLHWDHVSGLTELPTGVEVRVLAGERRFALGPDRPPFGVARGPLRDVRFAEFACDGPPVLTFTGSHDVFGDGSVLVVPLPGHTPGSVGVLLALDGGRRVLLAGDAAWHGLQVSRLREKAPFPGDLVDADRDAAFATLHRLHALPDDVEVVPAHDRAAATAFAPDTWR